MREITLEEIESVSGAVLSCADKWEIGGAILGGILGGWGGAAVGIGAGDIAANIIGC
jgi:outer membrane lipoprotein SlyB